MKSFAVGVARIAAIIVVVIVTLSGLGFGGFALWNHLETERNAPLEALKIWPPITAESLGGVTLRLSTKWREGRVLYHFRVAGYPPKIAAAMDGSTDASKWNLVFLDKDGFEAATVDVPIHKMSRGETGVAGQYTGLDANSDTYMSADNYRRAAGWDISWQGFAEPKLPAPVAGGEPTQARPVARPTPDVPKWKDIGLWRKLNRQMSKDQVRQLLGEPTRIEDGGVLVFWHYGYGRVTFRENGSIYGFNEP